MIRSDEIAAGADAREPTDAPGPAASPHATAGALRFVPAALVALLAAGVPLFVWGSLEDAVVVPRLAGTALLTGAALVAFALPVADDRAVVAMLRRVRWPLALLGALVAWAALCTALGVDTGTSLLGEETRYQGLLPLAMYALLCVASAAATARAGSARLLLYGVLVGGALAAGYATIQRLGLDWVAWQGVPEGRTGGAFAQPNVLGVELATAGVASLALWRRARMWERGVVAAGIGLMLAALLFTLSRGAWAGALAGVVACAVLVLLAVRSSRRSAAVDGSDTTQWRRDARKHARTAVAVLALLVALGVVLTAAPGGRGVMARTVDRARSSADLRDASISAHTGLWRTALEMVRDRPLTGGGPDAFSSLFASYRTPDQPEIGTANVRPESSHNYFLDQAVGLGIPGLALVIACFAGGVAVAWRAVRRDATRRIEVACMSAALGAYFVAVFFSFSEAMTGWLPWLLLGALLGTAALAAKDGDATPDIHSPEAPDGALPAGAFARRSTSTPALALRGAVATIGVLLIAGAGAVALADRAAGNASRAAARGDLSAAISDVRTATRLDPLARQYLYDLALYREQAADAGDATQLAGALSAYETSDTRFAATSYGAVGEARVLARMWTLNPSTADLSRIDALLARAVVLDPYNADVRAAADAIAAEIGVPSPPP